MSDPNGPVERGVLQATRRGWLPESVQMPLLATGLVGAVAFLGVSYFLGHPHLVLFGWFGVVYFGLALLAHFPPEVVPARVERWMSEWVGEVGVGFYALAALAVFGRLQVISTVEAGLSGFVVDTILRFSLDAALNFLRALIWPFTLLSELGLGPALAWTGVCYLLFRLGVLAFSSPAWMLEEGDVTEAER